MKEDTFIAIRSVKLSYLIFFQFVHQKLQFFSFFLNLKFIYCDNLGIQFFKFEFHGIRENILLESRDFCYKIKTMCKEFGINSCLNSIYLS